MNVFLAVDLSGLDDELVNRVNTGIADAIDAMNAMEDRITLLEDVIESLESVLAQWDEAANP
jgi:ethanolamine ammonia-lyase large subunit